ncbi:hypothetical protein, partial [Rhodanobacter sp. 115]|uniref:hypothetical protein n=1 Tax=Rhodanobacter sp. FW021-MT20 TaxID=1162282 RepID=UPI001ED94FA8
VALARDPLPARCLPLASTRAACLNLALPAGRQWAALRDPIHACECLDLVSVIPSFRWKLTGKKTG